MKKSLKVVFHVFVLLGILLSGCAFIPSKQDTGQKTVNVSSNGRGDFQTLEKAIEGIELNTIILLDEGQFELSEPLIIDKSLTIQGAGADLTTILKSGTGTPAIYFEGENLTIKDISLERTGEYASNVMVVKSGEVSLENCKMSGGGASDDSVRGDGLWLMGNSNVTVSECVFENNMGTGIFASENAKVTINRVTSSNNQNGIVFVGNSSGEIQNSTVSNNQDFGIFIAGFAKVNVVGNTIVDNASVGLHFQLEETNGEVRDNTLARNDMGGTGTDIMIWEEFSPALIGNSCDGKGQSVLGGDHNGIVFIARGSLPEHPTLTGNSCMVAKCTTPTGGLFSMECQ